MYDVKLILHSWASALTSSGYGKDEDGDAIVLHPGDCEGCKWQGRLIVRVDTISHDPHSPNLAVNLYLLGGNNASFTRQVVLSHLELGDNSQLVGNQDMLAGKYELLVQNELKGVIYPYVRVRYVISGTSPRILFRANLGKLY